MHKSLVQFEIMPCQGGNKKGKQPNKVTLQSIFFLWYRLQLHQ